MITPPTDTRDKTARECFPAPPQINAHAAASGREVSRSTLVDSRPAVTAHSAAATGATSGRVRVRPAAGEVGRHHRQCQPPSGGLTRGINPKIAIRADSSSPASSASPLPRGLTTVAYTTASRRVVSQVEQSSFGARGVGTTLKLARFSAPSASQLGGGRPPPEKGAREGAQSGNCKRRNALMRHASI